MEETTTVQIYREDLKKLESMCKKNENFRDKLHEILLIGKISKLPITSDKDMIPTIKQEVEK